MPTDDFTYTLNGGSQATVAVTVDCADEAPQAPTITATQPASPANNNNPLIKGSAEAGSTVSIYQSADCSGTAEAQGTAGEFASPGLSVSVADDQTATFTATATAGAASVCSAPFTYREDSTRPVASIDSGPVGSTDDPTPTFTFSANEPATFQCRLDANPFAACSGPGQSHTVAPPLAEGTYKFQIRATDLAGNRNPANRTFTVDLQSPSAPAIADTNPDSPANDNAPEVRGSLGSGSPTQVKIFTAPDCAGSPAAMGAATAFADGGITTTVPDDAVTTLSARASDAVGNDSACSNNFDYREDSTAPEAPDLNDTDPDSPANNNDPQVRGAAETGSTVRIYKGAACSGTSTVGSAAQLDSPGIVVHVGGNRTTTFRATATDQAGNASACSGPLDYVEDSQAPPTQVTSGPGSKTSDTTPTYAFRSDDASATFECSTDSSPFDPCTSPFTTEPLSVGQHTFRVRAKDAAGNVDATPALRNVQIVP